jgi:hypothetical protein
VSLRYRLITGDIFMKSSIIFRNSNFRRVALASAVVVGAFGSANSFAADASTTASAEVVAAIAITKDSDMNFGKFAPTATAGTVTLDTDGSVDGGANVTVLSSTSAAVARFTVSGEPSATYAITYPTGVSLSDGAATPNLMALTFLSEVVADGGTAAGGATGTAATGTLDATGGKQDIILGGTLDVGASQVTGAYTATFNIGVEYN